MNTLCHLCLGLDDPEWMLGQFLGDFARGPVDDLPYSEKVCRGIRAHRRVDAAGESHPLLRSVKQRLLPRERRYGGILLDLYGDYLLFRCWEHLLEPTWEEASANINDFLQDPPAPFPPDAARYADFLIRHNLLHAYANADALPEIFDRVGTRFRKPVSLSPLLRTLEPYEAQLIEEFPHYFMEMKMESDNICYS